MDADQSWEAEPKPATQAAAMAPKLAPSIMPNAVLNAAIMQTTGEANEAITNETRASAALRRETLRLRLLEPGKALEGQLLAFEANADKAQEFQDTFRTKVGALQGLLQEKFELARASSARAEMLEGFGCLREPAEEQA